MDGTLRGPSRDSRRADRAAALRRVLDERAPCLPALTPLARFTFRNPLRGYEHLDFHEAAELGRAKLGAGGYLPIDDYREALARGRIRVEDVDASLSASTITFPAAPALGLPDPNWLARLAVIHDVRPIPAASLAARLREEADERFAPGVAACAQDRVVGSPPRSDRAALAELWATCRTLSATLRPLRAQAENRPKFPRELFVAKSPHDPNELVRTLLVPACAAFVDRGSASWSMPGRDCGFFEAWSTLTTAGALGHLPWLGELEARLNAWRSRGDDASDVVLELLDELGVAESERGDFIEHTLLQLPGWASLFHELETSRRGSPGAGAARLVDFLAVRMILDVEALRYLGALEGHRGPLATLRTHLTRLPDAHPGTDDAGAGAIAWPLFLLAQHAGVSADTLARAGAAGAGWMLQVVRILDDHTRLQLWQEAYERRYRDELLRALASNLRSVEQPIRRSVQLVLCMDDREESLRRHFEELSPRHETFGAVAFVDERMASEGRGPPPGESRPLGVASPERLHRRFGPLESRLALPSFWERFVTTVKRALRTWVVTLGRVLHRPAREVEPRAHGDRDALDVSGIAADVVRDAGRAADVVEALLRGIGLTKDFARVVAILGHDSTAESTVYSAAYSCDACACEGRSAGRHAQIVAALANRRDVRDALRARGIDIPWATIFVGGVHDTATDMAGFYELAHVAPSDVEAVDSARQQLEQALARNAHERCRRLEARTRLESMEQALQRVKRRAHDAFEKVPELGHATNACCVIGARALTRGIFLDRRAFLVSYDAALDANGERLAKLLAAAVPACLRINLDHYFSKTDNEHYGAGPVRALSIVGLVGVADGRTSDLRVGLPRELVELHEPIRLQLVVETDAATLAPILARLPWLDELVKNDWLRLVLVHPDSRAISVSSHHGTFDPWKEEGTSSPFIGRSIDWYAGRTDPVPPVRLEFGPEATWLPRRHAESASSVRSSDVVPRTSMGRS